ncbi:purine or other phosphorylase family 1 [Stanieria cyanosphaera PCC 7437]|uniref:Purine or other phosphorylase family 1 n=1 Tax=Stanieria cyanosphaera (strain ATCC 29371 / PCC 7437) TaxID=111780 RepID=K9XY85_STAC7|nr:purine or other phosphorylase family 1 [Stanieria cyanosphaera]AFZ37061.1 purine or other phosphorylase family 1 [Stanieria cyanosphaera PCC 7437]
MNLPVDIIFVPHGAEYQAVEQGLKQTNTDIKLLSIPMGGKAVAKYCQQLKNKSWQHSGNRVLILGLCGSLSSDEQIGDVVLYQDCLAASKSSSLEKQIYQTDVPLTNLITCQLTTKFSLVRGVSCDRIITKVEEKLSLAQVYQADVVDMEGVAILQALPDCSVAILRVVSDDCRYNLPDLNYAFDRDRGQLKTIPLAVTLISQPQAAVRLIKGATKGLKVLQQITTQLFSSK